MTRRPAAAHSEAPVLYTLTFLSNPERPPHTRGMTGAVSAYVASSPTVSMVADACGIDEEMTPAFRWKEFTTSHRFKFSSPAAQKLLGRVDVHRTLLPVVHSPLVRYYPAVNHINSTFRHDT